MSIMQEKFVTAIVWKRFPQLLERPFRRGMFADVVVNQMSGSDLERDEYIKDTEAYSNGDEEVAGDNAVGHDSGETLTNAGVSIRADVAVV